MDASLAICFVHEIRCSCLSQGILAIEKEKEAIHVFMMILSVRQKNMRSTFTVENCICFKSNLLKI
jgi:hypothetical protein